MTKKKNSELKSLTFSEFKSILIEQNRDKITKQRFYYITLGFQDVALLSLVIISIKKRKKVCINLWTKQILGQWWLKVQIRIRTMDKAAL